MRMVRLGTAAAAAWSVPALAPVAPPLCDLMRIPRRLEAGARGVALTFDDGPHPDGTPALLDLLGEANAVATFFLIGEQVERWPDITARIVAEGHTVALHGQRHRNQLRLAPWELARDFERGAGTIEHACGRGPSMYRPPYGIFSPAGLAIARRRGLRTLLWSRWGHDWRGSATPEGIAAETTRSIGNGDVVLLHDADHYSDAGSWRNTLAAMPRILGTLEQLGLATVAPGGATRQPAASL